jgi:hypothetical protein
LFLPPPDLPPINLAVILRGPRSGPRRMRPRHQPKSSTDFGIFLVPKSTAVDLGAVALRGSLRSHLRVTESASRGFIDLLADATAYRPSAEVVGHRIRFSSGSRRTFHSRCVAGGRRRGPPAITSFAASSCRVCETVGSARNRHPAGSPRQRRWRRHFLIRQARHSASTSQ